MPAAVEFWALFARHRFGRPRAAADLRRAEAAGGETGGEQQSFVKKSGHFPPRGELLSEERDSVARGGNGHGTPERLSSTPDTRRGCEDTG
jgi:hypothetical protein